VKSQPYGIAPSIPTEVKQSFRTAYCLHHGEDRPYDGDTSASGISVNFYDTTRQNIPEGYHFNIRRRENLKSQL
jgi:hypothetical protein